ncbi:unnamed protein product [Cylicocyclus nassatus]|uniref:Uncharacterized protein n=1 Tax=Cylicocyclus nassatus TaxID=53992 RepID=A0AA36HDF3_CYLNA|nr:unnamed protein product [Cylicocyclus nassatus]
MFEHNNSINCTSKIYSKEKLFIPHVSTLNAMAILYSLAYGWKAPDKKFGELVANFTLLRDCIDAALHSTSTDEE